MEEECRLDNWIITCRFKAKTRLVDAFGWNDVIGIRQLPLSGTHSLPISSTHVVYPVQLEVRWISARWILEISSTMSNI